MLNVILCGYREWAKTINNTVANFENIHCIKLIESKDEYDVFFNSLETLNERIDFILFVGWSWIIKKDILDKYLCLGIHPSDLPQYRGGSPLQHQIIKGLTNSKVTLMSLSSKKIDAGDIYLKEDLDLSGHKMDVVFEHIVESSIKMLKSFVKIFLSIKPIEQNLEVGTYFKRRTPLESKISKVELVNMSLIELYNFIRALTDPYPNAYLEDEDGNKLVIKEVEYLPVKK